MNTIRLTMAQALVRFLENQYVAYDDVEQPFVRGVFMLPGHGNVVGLGQALLQEARRLEHVRQLESGNPRFRQNCIRPERYIPHQQESSIRRI